MNEIAKVISRLEQHRAAIDRALAALREIEAVEPKESASTPRAAGAGQPKKRRMSAAGRRNIAEAVRKRWAEKRAAEAQSSQRAGAKKAAGKKVAKKTASAAA